MQKKLLLLVWAFTLIISTLDAATKYYFYVQLANKNNTPYLLSTPADYLSARAIARREAFNIPIDSTDLPVNASYISQIVAKGVNIHCRSKWMNGITVLTSDSSLMGQVRSLPFVKWAKYTGKIDLTQPVSPRKSKFATQTFNYGTAATQLNQLNASYLHNGGYTGKNIHVAVLDAGFLNANVNVGFDSLRLQGRLLGTKDFSEPVSNIYGSDSHGSNVLAIMTGNLANQYLGATPHASFWLIRTEYAPTENMSEIDFWVAGIEFADSVGVDVVNSSLGYTTFDDPSMNFTYSNMNGTFSRASRAATIAAQKGIIVCNSAGNEGNKTWHYIGVPADAEGIVTVGAATSTGEPSLFTSYGPTADNRQKPELSAMGTSTAYINTSGTLASGNGTSYSSPIMAGMFACFLQYAKANLSSFNIQTLIQAAQQSANLYASPTDRLGYGLPNFQQACFNLTILSNTENKWNEKLQIYQDNVSNNIQLLSKFSSEAVATIYNLAGIVVHSCKLSNSTTIIPTKNMSKGIYFVQVTENSASFSKKIMLK